MNPIHKRIVRFAVFAAATLLLHFTQGDTALAQEYTIKFATLAPEGTTWMAVMREYDATIRKESNGRLGFKLYPSAVQGDEKDVLRKMKLGQLHAAGITGNGLTTIAPSSRILDSPFLFRSTEEIDHIYEKFGPEIDSKMQSAGYVNLGWAEVGFVYIFTNTPVAKEADLAKTKMWMWEGDPVAEATFKALHISPIPLSITDVLTSLQTKLIDGVYTSPLAAIALQWFTRVKYMLDAPLANAAGAVVISKKRFDELPPDLREILMKNGKKYMRKLTEASRKDNAKSLETLKKSGIKVTEPPSSSDLQRYAELGHQARQMLVGKLYSQEFLDRVEGELAALRNKTR